MSQNKLTFFTALKFLYKYIKPYKIEFFRFYIGWAVNRILILISPIIFGIMIDEIVYYQNINTFLNISALYILILIFSSVLYFMIYALHHYLMNMYTLKIKIDTFNHIHYTDAEVMSGNKTGDLINITKRYTSECMHFVIRNLLNNSNDYLSLTFLVTYLFIINWKIGFLILIIAPISVFVNTKYGKKIRLLTTKERNIYGNYSSWLFEILSSITHIRLLNSTKKIKEDFSKYNHNLYDVKVKSSIATLTSQNIITGVNLFMQLSIYSTCALLIVNNEIRIGSLIVILSYFNTTKMMISNISKNYMDMQQRIAYVQKIHDFLTGPTEKAWKGTKALSITQGRIILENIHFSYKNSNKLIRDLSIKIEPGQHLALVGKSGCGKTTLAYMLLGFYKPSNGHIVIDNQKLNECSLSSIRNQIGIVQQDVLLFDGTFKSNIIFGKQNASDEEIKAACINAGIWDFIYSFPSQLETEIGTQGIQLSGGQKQRISIARIYLRNPKIIIFDEATSALDSDTENFIHQAWKKVLHNRTAIMIAHRLSSVMLCDEVAIMEEGKIIEIGNPKTLSMNSEKFRTLFALEHQEEGFKYVYEK